MKEITAEQFGKHMPAVTAKVLQELMDRKDEVTRWKNAAAKATLFLFVLLAVFLFYVFVIKQGLLSRFSPGMFRETLSDPFIWLLAIGLIACFFRLRHVTAKYEEADDDYEALRCELIERSTELWPKLDQWEGRDRYFAYLENEYDINLYFKE